MTNSNWFTKSFNFSRYAAEVVRWNGVGYGFAEGSHSKTLESQWELVVEEGKEVTEALIARNKKEFLKELIDTFVVATYYDHLKYDNDSYSMPFMVEVNRLNLLSVSYLITLIQSRISNNDSSGVLKATFALMLKLDADVEGALEEVLRSNWSKFVTYNAKDETTYDKECKRIEEDSDGRYTGVSWDVRESLVVFTDSNGKIMKALTYSEPELEQFINWGT